MSPNRKTGSPDSKQKTRARRALTTIPSEDTYAAAPRNMVGILTEALDCVGAKVMATVLAPGVHRRGEVRERTDRMAATRNAGHEAVRQQ